jgi:NADPH:quinone reductase-like Zn-dependent oxidoreductase
MNAMAQATEQVTTMRAFVRRRYGSTEQLELAEVPRPELVDDGVLVRVRATSVNRGDWYVLRGTPWVARPMVGLLAPKSPFFGGDFAGTVEAVGKDVAHVAAGDEVYGVRTGAFAEYVCARVGVALKPAGLTFEEAAAVPVAAITALQGLRDHGRLQPGQKVLVNGASGGVGTFAVQIAKALGAEVTAVCSTRNVERARSLGADHVIDYAREDFTRDGRRYDLVFDNAGTRSWRACQRVLEPRGVVVLVGGPQSPVLGPLGHIGATLVAARASRGRKAVFFVAKVNVADLDVVRELIEAGQVTPVVERRYELSELGDALRYMGEGHAQGKLVVTV